MAAAGSVYIEIAMTINVRKAKKEARNRLYPAVLSPLVLRVTIRDIIEPNSVRKQIMLTSPKCKGVSANVIVPKKPSGKPSPSSHI